MNGSTDPAPHSPPDAPEDHGLPAVTPDVVEQEKGEEIDNAVPTEGYARLPVVGLGGSAGGLTALQAFFGAMPPDSGMAFVVIMHLSPEHDSILAELLQRSTPMPVRQVRDRTKVEANHVYVIPPAKHLSMADSCLHLSDFARVRPGKHVAVDLFFRTLADSHGAHCAAIVLSGADGDGAIGIKRIKERGGLTIAQLPDEAEQDSMPRSSIATGMVDWVLPAAEMPARLCEYWNTEKRLRLPPEEGPPPARALAAPAADDGQTTTTDETALHDVLAFLRARTGRDFTYYKRATILRRIARRMQVNGIEEMPHYLGFLRTHPGESGALLQDVLISVTNFFRDREAFAVLETAIPNLFRGKGPKDTVRVWCAACATGEEAYSVAMLLTEYTDRLDHPPTIQVFATDLDENAIAQARDGTYPETIAADVSEERLRRFFNKGHGNYRVKREMREIVLFALHDLLGDSPFSRLDLVTCRNLLIYLTRDAQNRALDIFHFSLNPEGTLFLGTSESVDNDNPLFVVSDKKFRLYARRTLTRPKMPPVFMGPTVQVQALMRRHQEAPVLPRLLPPPPAPASAGSLEPANALEGGQVSWSEVHSRAVEQFGAPSVIIDSRHALVHLSGHAGRLLQFNDGEVTTDLLRVVHPMLRVELRAAIFRAEQSGEVTETLGVPVDIEGVRRAVDLRVAPAVSGAPGFLLIIFTEREFAAGATTRAAEGVGTDAAIRELERQLEHSKGQLRDTVEQADASHEELKAANEELQATNEELRSTSEELETGREELQSINEELTTVNLDMKSKVEELATSNSDLANLMASTQIATIFLDRALCIQRYTPPAVALFSLIPTDVGRPLSDQTTKLNYPDLSADAERVLDDLTVAELEVPHRDGRYFLAQMRPYRTEDDHISGVVLTFVDITTRKQAEEALRKSEELFRSFVAVISDTIYTMNADWSVMHRLEGKRFLTDTRVPDRTWLEHYIPPGEWPVVSVAVQEAVTNKRPFELEHRVIRADGTMGWALSRAIPLLDARGEISEWSGAALDVTERSRAEAAVRASEGRLKLVLESARDFAIFTLDEHGIVTSWNRGAQALFGYAAGEIIGHSGMELCTPEDRAAGVQKHEMATACAEGSAWSERWHCRKEGSTFWGSGSLVPLEAGEPGFLAILSDRTQARRVEEELEEHRRKLVESLQQNERARTEIEAASHAKDHFLAVLSHELRTPLTPVVMATHMLARTPGLPPAAQMALETIQRNVQIESQFIDDLLDLTKIAHGKLEITREPTDLHEAVRRAVEISAADLEGKHQPITVALEAASHEVQGDATRLQQVFWNLLKNASKFTPKGGAIRVTSRDEPGRIVVEVADTGIGFNEEAATRIFDAFAQASVEVTRRFGGLGLGLAISKATVDAHEGTLSARSDGLNQGAIFTVELPSMPGGAGLRVAS